MSSRLSWPSACGCHWSTAPQPRALTLSHSRTPSFQLRTAAWATGWTADPASTRKGGGSTGLRPTAGGTGAKRPQSDVADPRPITPRPLPITHAELERAAMSCVSSAPRPPRGLPAGGSALADAAWRAGWLESESDQLIVTGPRPLAAHAQQSTANTSCTDRPQPANSGMNEPGLLRNTARRARPPKQVLTGRSYGPRP